MNSPKNKFLLGFFLLEQIIRSVFIKYHRNDPETTPTLKN